MVTKRYILSLYHGDFTVCKDMRITEKQAKEFIESIKDIAKKTETDTDIYACTELSTDKTVLEKLVITTYHLEGGHWFDIWIEKYECKQGYHFTK